MLDAAGPRAGPDKQNVDVVLEDCRGAFAGYSVVGAGAVGVPVVALGVRVLRALHQSEDATVGVVLARELAKTFVLLAVAGAGFPQMLPVVHREIDRDTLEVAPVNVALIHAAGAVVKVLATSGRHFRTAVLLGGAVPVGETVQVINLSMLNPVLRNCAGVRVGQAFFFDKHVRGHERDRPGRAVKGWRHLGPLDEGLVLGHALPQGRGSLRTKNLGCSIKRPAINALCTQLPLELKPNFHHINGASDNLRRATRYAREREPFPRCAGAYRSDFLLSFTHINQSH